MPMSDTDKGVLRNVKSNFEAKFGRPCTLDDETLISKYNEFHRGGLLEDEVFEWIKDDEAEATLDKTDPRRRSDGDPGASD